MNPIKPTIKTEIIPVIFVILSIVLSFYFYAEFPDQVPIHWNFKGEVDDYGSRGFAAFVLPLVIVGMYAMFLFIPRLDPKKERYEQFQKVYHIFKAILIVFMALIYIVTSFSVLGFGLSPATFIPVAVGVLMIVLGNYMAKIKPNWFMGIRTPWTMSSEVVWNKTHRLGGKVFVLSGFIFMAMPWLSEKLKIAGFATMVLLMSVGTILYSYLVYRQEENKKKNS